MTGKIATKDKKTSYHHGDLRAALVEATRALIEDKGIDHFSVSDACRRAGVSTAAPYKHFKNKDEMVLAVMLQSMAEHRQQMLDDIAPFPPGSPDRVKALGQNYIHFAMTQPGMFRLRFGRSDACAPPQVEAAGNDIYAIVLREVADCLGEAEITQKVRERAYMLWSFVHGISCLRMVPELAAKEGGEDTDKLLTEMGARLLRD